MRVDLCDDNRCPTKLGLVHVDLLALVLERLRRYVGDRGRPLVQLRRVQKGCRAKQVNGESVYRLL